jgi:hypothetical protein
VGVTADDQCERVEGRFDGLGRKLYNVVSRVFMTSLRLFSRRKSVGLSRCEKS